jgi:very-short-patch-repair endonuclease
MNIEEKPKRPIQELKRFSRTNKKRDVSAESHFRQALLKQNIHYQRQKVIDRFIIDFYFPKRNLIVEIDEKHHEYRKDYDKQRQLILEGYGYKVIRFKDSEIYSDVSRCIKVVLMESESKDKYRTCKQRLVNINKR